MPELDLSIDGATLFSMNGLLLNLLDSVTVPLKIKLLIL